MKPSPVPSAQKDLPVSVKNVDLEDAAPSGKNRCEGGGGSVHDEQTKNVFSRVIMGYCIDPELPTKSYGEKAELTMDEICTTAFDGECEIYRDFGLKRLVQTHYVQNAGNGSVEVNLSQFVNPSGALAMFTKRVVAGGDPSDPTTARAVEAGALAATGTGRAYVVKGPYVAELTYSNSTESPAKIARSSDPILRAMLSDLGEKLPGDKGLPASATRLPSENRIPSSLVYFTKDAFDRKGLGEGAMAFYKTASQEPLKRYRMYVMERKSEALATEVIAKLRSQKNAAPYSSPSPIFKALLTDEGVKLASPGASLAPYFYFVRKGHVVVGVSDEEYSLSAMNPDDSKDEKKIQHMRLDEKEVLEALAKLLSKVKETPSAQGAGDAIPSKKP